MKIIYFSLLAHFCFFNLGLVQDGHSVGKEDKITSLPFGDSTLITYKFPKSINRYVDRKEEKTTKAFDVLQKCEVYYVVGLFQRSVKIKPPLIKN